MKEPCRRCTGNGFMPHFSHVQGGVCFRCNGSRVDPGVAPKRRLIRKIRHLSPAARARLAALMFSGGVSRFTRLTDVGRELVRDGLVEIDFTDDGQIGLATATDRGSKSFLRAIRTGMVSASSLLA